MLEQWRCYLVIIWIFAPFTLRSRHNTAHGSRHTIIFILPKFLSVECWHFIHFFKMHILTIFSRFICQSNSLISAFLIDFSNVLVPFCHYYSAYILEIAVLWTFFDRMRLNRILRKYSLQQKVFWKTNSLNILLGHINKFRFLIKATVIITNTCTFSSF